MFIHCVQPSLPNNLSYLIQNNNNIKISDKFHVSFLQEPQRQILKPLESAIGEDSTQEFKHGLTLMFGTKTFQDLLYSTCWQKLKITPQLYAQNV